MVPLTFIFSARLAILRHKKGKKYVTANRIYTIAAFILGPNCKWLFVFRINLNNTCPALTLRSIIDFFIRCMAKAYFPANLAIT